MSRGHLCRGIEKSGSVPCTWAGLINSNGLVLQFCTFRLAVNTDKIYYYKGAKPC